MEVNGTLELFGDFCSGYPLWDVSEIEQNYPKFSPCLTETALVWIPCGFLWLALIPYVLYVLDKDREATLPWSKLQVIKSIFTVALFALVIADIFLTKSNGYMCSEQVGAFPAFYVGAGVRAATYVLILILEQFNRVRGIPTSGIPFVFWSLMAIAGIVPFYTTLTAEVWCSSSTVQTITFVLLWLQLLLRCFADQYNTRGYHELGLGPCPEEGSSVLTRVTYNWVTSLVIKAYKTTLTTNDLWEQTSRLKSRNLVPKFRRSWRRAESALQQKRIREHVINYSTPSSSADGRDKYNSEKTPLLSNGFSDIHTGNGLTFSEISPEMTTGPSLFKVLFQAFGWLWLEACLYKVIGDGFNLLQPLILQGVIGIIETRETTEVPEWIGYAYTIALFATSLFKSLLYHCAFNHMVCLGLSMKTALIGAVYRKALTMSHTAKRNYTIGEIVNLMSVDCQRVQDAFTFSHYLASLPFVLVVSMVQLWYFMGIAMLGGLAVVVLATAVNGYLGRLQQQLQKQILGLKGKRIKILNEVINGIKVLKMYTWETPFQQRVTSIRNQEISRLWKYAIIMAVSILFSVHSPFMVNYVLVLIYTLSNAIHYLDAQTAFVVLSLVNILRGPITITPFVITGIIQGHVSISRLQAFLWKDDMDMDNVTVTEKGEYVIHIEKGSFTWDRRNPRPTLRNINMAVKQNKLYAVVGQVGCGKSSLMSAILGEMNKVGGDVTLKGTLAYVPQEAWIQNLTVRDNILFGKEMDEQRYNKVLSGCALLTDLSILSGGDMTEIGEKGINISGGQKQRVSLARAVYSDADVYLMDDPLSAVDSHVGKHLFKNVIGPQGLLKHKTRILVTHGIHWLPMVDRILVLTDGIISEEGTYEELISRNGAFAQFIQNHGNDDDESDADDAEVQQLRHKVLSDVENVASGGGTSDDAEPEARVRRRRRKSSGREKSFGMSFSKAHVGVDNKSKNETMSRLVKEEESQKGAVKFGVFKAYAKAMGYLSLPFVALFMIGFQALNVFSNYWLTYWTEDELLKNVSQGYTEEYESRFVYYLVWYTIIGVIQGAAILGFGILALTRMVRASGLLHKEMLQCILRSPMSFFDTTPIGRIMNRFSSDIDVMDDRLPLNFRLWNIQIFATIATLIVVSINTPPFMIVIVPTMIVYIMLLKFFLPTARQVKRLESVLRSPIYNHFSETITGASVIRAYRCTQRFILDSEQRVDKNIKFFFAANSASRWIGVRLEFLGNILILAATLFALLADGLNGAEVGLSITYALQITISLNLVIQAISEMEMNIVSAERVKEYTELHPEAPWLLPHRRPRIDWPNSGSVEFRQYCTRYREGLDLVLKGISCHLASGEKIGIVGRTGAGKSSMTLSLFRLIESASGSILIDGENIADMGLHDIRNKLTILPQDPVLFSGSLRENLDPFGRFDEAAIWKAIECAHLKNAVVNMNGQLDYECGEGGSNLSMGQRQLVCLARTLLHKTRVLILDEATAAVDLETDDLIQNTIRTEFSDCTILTIAHRLNTILDYDRVMVLSDGTIQEMDEPSKLLQNPNSAFYKLAKDAGLVS